MNLLKEAFIEGYKQRAEGSDLIFDNASRMYAISLFDKYQAEQLTLTDVGNCPFEAYAVFCIECDRKGIKPIKHKDYLNLG